MLLMVGGLHKNICIFDLLSAVHFAWVYELMNGHIN